MRYLSTRGWAPALDFENVLLSGLAGDGGLYLPESLPRFSSAELRGMASLDYVALAHRVISPFVAGCVDDDALRDMLRETYGEFRHPAVAPLVQLDRQLWVLELFHGPTLAFKDFALQFLGRLLDAVLRRRGERAVILGATSGDTGSAAISGCRRCDNVDIFILHPQGRVSEIQRRQMTTLSGPGIHNLAIAGGFDDCQAMVKASFLDRAFLPPGRRLLAVNSINWARVMAQIVYYFYAALALGAPDRSISFAVPTGNFGDIYAGYLASRMGLPVQRLMVATNRNDVLHRLLRSGTYERQPLQETLSPSMDISVASNFERLLFDLHDRDAAAVAGLMRAFESGPITLSERALSRARTMFASHRADDVCTLTTIRDLWRGTGYLLDPHSATGVAAARRAAQMQSTTWISLATAHPAKFPEAIAQAEVPVTPSLPAHLEDLLDRPEHFEVLPNSLAVVQRFMAEHLGS